jgi:hypothetical protein
MPEPLAQGFGIERACGQLGEQTELDGAQQRLGAAKGKPNCMIRSGVTPVVSVDIAILLVEFSATLRSCPIVASARCLATQLSIGRWIVAAIAGSHHLSPRNG